MATLHVADLARRRHGHRLLAAGAHSLEVKRVRRGTRSTFVVVASFATAPVDPPTAVKVTVNGKSVSVPVVVKIAPPFTIDGPP